MAQLPFFPALQRTTTRYEVRNSGGSIAEFRPKLRFRSEIIPERQLYWLIYQEEQEREFIVSSYFATSPLGYDNDCKGHNSQSRWRFVRNPSITASDDELSGVLRKAFRGLFRRISGKVPVLPEVEAEESLCRQRELIEPWSRCCSEFVMLQEILQGKLVIWNNFLKKLDMWKKLLDVVYEEKIARVQILGQFISCNTPLPCKYLLWDLEILENSAIFLEPEVNLICLFVSIVIGENDSLQASLLAEREKELSLLSNIYELSHVAFGTVDNIRKEEHGRYEALMRYHSFCMKIAGRQGIQTLIESHYSQGELNSRERLLARRRSYESHFIKQQESPFIPYFLYLRILKTLCIEEETREEIVISEFNNFLGLMNAYETLCRRSITSTEEVVMQRMLIDMEASGRRVISSAEATFMKEHICPDVFLRRSSLLLQEMREDNERRLQEIRMRVIIDLLLEYEQQRRGTILLFENEVRKSRRLFFYTAIDKERGGYVAQKWMILHELRVLGREEEKKRMRIITEERNFITPRIAAHEWLVANSGAMYNKMLKGQLQVAVAHLTTEEEKRRAAIISQCLQERHVLFEVKLSVPVFPAESKKTCLDVRHDGSKAEPQELGIRQEVLSELNAFVHDDTLLTLFDPLLL